MVHVILLILKIIGIIILSILSLLLLILMLILFVPIRYQVHSNNEDGIVFTGKVSWLLHFINVRLDYKDALTYYIRIFCIKIYPSKNKSKSTTSKGNKQKRKSSKNVIKKEEQNKKNTIYKNKAKIKPEVKTEKKSQEKSNINSKPTKKEKNKFTFRSVYDKIKNTVESIKKNINLITDERTKRAFKLCKKELIHMLKAIFPRKIKGIIELGLKNPAQTGEIYGLYSALFPVHKGNIIMIPYFEEEMFSYKIVAIGHIRLITLLVIAIKVYFNKDIQRLIKIFKKEE